MRTLSCIDPDTRRAARRARRGGFTLVEVLISCTVLALFLGSIGAVVLSSRGIYEQGLSVATLEARARRTAERIAGELTAARRASVVTTATSLQFTTVTGYAAGAQQVSTPTRLELQPDPRDATDGVDNDRDGLVDEQQVVLVRNAGMGNEMSVVLVSGVRRWLEGEVANLVDDNANGLIDERGLSTAVDANGTITIRLSLDGIDPNNRLLTRTVQTSVHMRN